MVGVLGWGLGAALGFAVYGEDFLYFFPWLVFRSLLKWRWKFSRYFGSSISKARSIVSCDGMFAFRGKYFWRACWWALARWWISWESWAFAAMARTDMAMMSLSLWSIFACWRVSWRSIDCMYSIMFRIVLSPGLVVFIVSVFWL